MTLYSDFGPRRARQISGDVLALSLIGAWVWLGLTVYELVENLAGFGEQMEEAGAGFEQTMTEVGSALGGIPLIGGGIRAPFDDASGAGGALEAAGQSQQIAINQLATGLGVGIAALPIVMILVLWLVPRIRFARKAGQVRAAVKSGAGIDLFALRALATQEVSTLSKIDPDAVGAWRRGDEAVMRALAHLELKNSGVRLPGR
ncbi:hypothetical protein [Mycetocola sp. 2940]|uniref:hypothetical protein n=1 Tax=Mycetocola sp. 2940 TaxID=3156452 RepID=UPI0033975C36